MSQPVRLSDSQVPDARLTAEIAQRPIAGQIEFRAGPGQAIDPLLRGHEALRLRQAGQHRPLSECLNSVDSAEGRRRVTDYLKSLPFPHYEAAPGKPGYLIRLTKSGERTLGHFVNRHFVAEHDES